MLSLGLFALFGVSLGLPPLFRNQSFQAAVAAVFRYTPPFAAARAMIGTESLSLFLDMLMLLGWCAGLAVLLLAVDRLPAPSQARLPGFGPPGTAPTTGSPLSSVPSLAPLVGQTLRYYVRSPHTRYNYFLTLPLLAFMLFRPARSQSAPMDLFLTALGLIPLAGMMCTGALPLNVFGFDAPGFRRYLLQPVAREHPARGQPDRPDSRCDADPDRARCFGWCLRQSTPTRACWPCCSPAPWSGGCYSTRSASGPACFRPRPIEFNLRFGNKLSLGGEHCLHGVLRRFLCRASAGLRALGAIRVLRYWWVAPLIMFATTGFYLLSVRAGAVVFAARRERILSLLEGRG